MNKNLSPKLNLLLFSTKYNLVEINNDRNYNPFDNLFSQYSDEEIKEIVQIKNQNIVHFFYLNKEKIHKAIYNLDYLIKIVPQNFETKFSNYFYLALLIEDNEEVINYEFDYKIIDDFYKIKSKGEFYDLIYAKIMNDLIKNFNNTTDNDSEDNEKENHLNEIKDKFEKRLDSEEIQKKLKAYQLNYTSTNFENIKLDEIYINIIINVLLKSDEIDEKEKLINDIDLENIELTESMLNKIYEFFNGEEKNKYIISEAKDFYDEKKLNFYFYLCKYILKTNYYIYQINFLKELKQKFITILNKDNQQLFELDNSHKNQKKFQYIKEFFINNDKRIIKIESESKVMFEANSGMNRESQNRGIPGPYDSSSSSNGPKKIYQDSILSQSQISTHPRSEYRNQPNKNNSEDIYYSFEDNKYELLHFKKYIMNFGNIKSKQILELGNNCFVKIDFHNIVYIYNKDYYYSTHFNNNEYIHKINNLNKIDDNLVIIETNYFKYTNLNDLDTELRSNVYKSNQYFEIKNTYKQKEYLTSGTNGLYRSTALTSKENYDDKISDESLLNGIRITDNLYAFFSNEKFNEGKNIIKIYDTSREVSGDLNNNNPKTIHNIKTSDGKISCPSYNNPLYVVDVRNNYKILLCACRSYTSNEANGILIIKIETNEFKTRTQTLIDTEDFEVCCFCTIYQRKDYAYILAGGFECDKRRGMIKLYKLTFNEFYENANIEYIQDAIEDFDSFSDEDFDGRINNIFIPKTKKKDVIVQCFGGSCYLFSLPKDDDYIQVYENEIY